MSAGQVYVCLGRPGGAFMDGFGTRCTDPPSFMRSRVAPTRPLRFTGGMRVYDTSTARRLEFTIILNWSRPFAFSARQRRWIRENVPNVRGVYVIYAPDASVSYGRGRRSGVIYVGSGWMNDRLFSHLKARRNDVLSDCLDRASLCFRWAEVEHDDAEDWAVVAESLLVYGFEASYGDFPPANRNCPPRRPALDYSVIEQKPLDVISAL